MNCASAEVDPPVTDSLEKLIHALREELQQAGEMLARLDQQPQPALSRTAEGLLRATAALERQSQTMQRARRERCAGQAEVARSLKLPEDTSFEELVPLLPEDYRPLVTALEQENRDALSRIYTWSQQHHQLLCRAVEMMSRLLGELKPGGLPPVGDNQAQAMSGNQPTLTLCPAND